MWIACGLASGDRILTPNRKRWFGNRQAPALTETFSTNPGSINEPDFCRRPLPMKSCKLIAVALVLVMTSSVSQADSKKDKVPGLIKDLKAKDVKTRIAAAEELGHIGQVKKSYAEPAVPGLIEALKDSDAGVRKAAADALGKVDPNVEVAVPALVDALKDKAPPVRQAAATALGQIGPDAKEAVDPLRELQNDS